MSFSKTFLLKPLIFTVLSVGLIQVAGLTKSLAQEVIVAEDELAIRKEALFAKLQAESKNLQSLSAKLVQARESFAQSFLDIGVWAIEARNAGRTCDLEAFAHLPVVAFLQALQVNKEVTLARLGEEAALAAEVKKNLLVNVHLKSEQATSDEELFQLVLPGTYFYGPAQAPLGNAFVIRFTEVGKVEIDRTTFVDGEPSKITQFGTYTVVLVEGSAAIKITLNNDEELSYNLGQDKESGQFLLIPAPNSSNTDLATPFPSECEG
jgi:hypothetical protein